MSAFASSESNVDLNCVVAMVSSDDLPTPVAHGGDMGSIDTETSVFPRHAGGVTTPNSVAKSWYHALKQADTSIPKALTWSMPSVAISAATGFTDGWAGFIQLEDFGFDRSQVWWAATSVLLVLLTFRTQQAFSRYWEGTGLLHQMRAEWFESASCCVSFTRAMKTDAAEKVSNFRLTLVRLISLMHALALEGIHSSSDACIEHTVIYDIIDVRGLDEETLDYLRWIHEECRCYKVEAVLHMIQTLITHHWEAGILRIPAPIMARVFENLSRGFVGYVNAKKVTDTVFPNVYAQLIICLLCFLSVFTPIIAHSIVEQPVVAGFVAFIPVFGMFCVNFIAAEIEKPFGSDKNDLPVAKFQDEMSRGLVMLMHEGADHLCFTKIDALHNWHGLWKQTRDARLSESAGDPVDGEWEPSDTSFAFEPCSTFWRAQMYQENACASTADVSLSAPARRVSVPEYLERCASIAVRRSIRGENPEAIARAVVDVAVEEGGTGSPAEVATAMNAAVAAQIAIAPLRADLHATMERLDLWACGMSDSDRLAKYPSQIPCRLSNRSSQPSDVESFQPLDLARGMVSPSDSDSDESAKIPRQLTNAMGRLRRQEDRCHPGLCSARKRRGEAHGHVLGAGTTVAATESPAVYSDVGDLQFASKTTVGAETNVTGSHLPAVSNVVGDSPLASERESNVLLESSGDELPDTHASQIDRYALGIPESKFRQVLPSKRSGLVAGLKVDLRDSCQFKQATAIP